MVRQLMQRSTKLSPCQYVRILITDHLPSSFQFKSHILIHFSSTLIYSYILHQKRVCNQYAIKATSWKQHKYQTRATNHSYTLLKIGQTHKRNQAQSSCLHRTSIVSKTLFIVPTDAHYYKIIEMLKQFKDYNTCSDMFRFTQEPSSGSSPVLS